MALVHALSLSTRVTLAHGYQNGVLLPWVADFNRPAVRSWVRDEIDRVRPLYGRIGFERRFATDEIDGSAAKAMVSVALASPLSDNNTRAPEPADLRTLLEGAGGKPERGRRRLSAADKMASTTTPHAVARYLRGRDLKMLVGGEFVDASDGATSKVVDPSTGEVVGAVPVRPPPTSSVRSMLPARRRRRGRRSGSTGAGVGASSGSPSCWKATARNWRLSTRSCPAIRSGQCGWTSIWCCHI